MAYCYIYSEVFGLLLCFYYLQLYWEQFSPYHLLAYIFIEAILHIL